MTDTNNISNALPIIGILGSGQLAAMMARAYQMIGGRAYVYGESLDSPAGLVANEFFLGSAHDIGQLVSFFDAVDVVTLENEFYSGDELQEACRYSITPVYPEPEKFGLIEDKLSEKRFFEDLGIPVAPYFEVTSVEDLPDQPGFLKIAKGGYDGIGTYHVQNREQATAIYEQINASGPLLFEYQVEFNKELSLIAVGGGDNLVFYPMVATHQEQGTCRFVSYPSGISAQLEQQARDYVRLVMDSFDTRGVFAFEFFLTAGGQLVLNESAPRPHNSGHITLDLLSVSQFENHMRSVAGLRLKNPIPLKDSALMVNLLATREDEFRSENVAAVLTDTQLHVELYGKRKTRPKRKMGHINLWGADQWQRAKQIVNDLDI